MNANPALPALPRTPRELREAPLPMLRHYRVGLRLYAGFIMLILSMVFMGILGQWSLIRVADHGDAIQATGQLVEHTQSMKVALAMQQRHLFQLMEADADGGDQQRHWGMVQAQNTAIARIFGELLTLIQAVMSAHPELEVDSLVSVVESTRKFYQDEYWPQLAGIQHSVEQIRMATGAKETATMRFAEAFERIFQRAEAFETAVQGQMAERIAAGYTVKELIGKENTWVNVAVKIKVHLALARLAMVDFDQAADDARRTQQKTRFNQSLAEVDTWVKALLDGNFDPNNRIMWVDNEAQRKLLEEINTDRVNVLIPQAEDFMAQREKSAREREGARENRGRALSASERMGDLLAQVDHMAREQSRSSLEAAANITGRMSSVTLWILLVSMLASGLTAWVLTLSITRPLHRLRAFAQAMAGGDLTVALSPRGQDEITHLARSLHTMQGNLRAIMEDLEQNARALADNANQMEGISSSLGEESSATLRQAEDMAGSVVSLGNNLGSVTQSASSASDNMSTITSAAQQVTGDLHTLSAAAEEASINLKAVSHAVEDVNTGLQSVGSAAQDTQGALQSVAGSVQELALSLGDVRRSCQSAADQSDSANARSEESSRLNKEMDQSARDVGRVVRMIQEIADRTGMLALNAAIEAAGAGEAGKGFAVVAVEVKELASQTAQATQQIVQQVRAIQTRTGESVRVSGEITGLVTAINQANQAILQAVAEQDRSLAGISDAMGRVTRQNREVADHVVDISRAVEEASRNVREISLGITEVSGSVAGAVNGLVAVTDSVTGASTESRQIRAQVERMTVLAADLDGNARAVRGAAQGLNNLGSRIRAQAGGLTGMSAALGGILARFRLH
ncbi:MAG: methyl-accepting chemotaxis protein [Magnetococcus sp. WYHC-3]